MCLVMNIQAGAGMCRLCQPIPAKRAGLGMQSALRKTEILAASYSKQIDQVMKKVQRVQTNLETSRNVKIFYKNLIELSPGQRGVDLIIGLESQSRQPARVVSGLNKPIFNLTQYFIRSQIFYSMTNKCTHNVSYQAGIIRSLSHVNSENNYSEVPNVLKYKNIHNYVLCVIKDK